MALGISLLWSPKSALSLMTEVLYRRVLGGWACSRVLGGWAFSDGRGTPVLQIGQRIRMQPPSQKVLRLGQCTLVYRGTLLIRKRPLL